MKNSPIQPARLEWNLQGTPVSQEFDDVYFSNQNGLAESEYVFLQGNRLPDRFLHHPERTFVIAETGLGTGLNFLAAWRAFRRFRHTHPDATLRTLHFVSCEKFPLTEADLSAAHACWPELAELSAALQQQWPLPIAGCHRLLLEEGAVMLDIWIGDVQSWLPDLTQTLYQRVDAWFLDGFAPAKNPEMWTPALFETLAATARSGCTLATFTAAGFVRRGLESVGFTMQRSKGFGQKREMLRGYRDETPRPIAAPPWYHRPAAQQTEDIAIIGGGVASATAAEALMRRGAKVTLYCQDERPALGASCNRQGALYPLLTPDDSLLSRFFSAAFLYARHFYDQLAQQGIQYDHAWCGVTQLAYDENSRLKLEKLQAGAWPETLVNGLSEEAITAACGLPTGHAGVTYPLGGWLCPAELTSHVIETLIHRGLQAHWQHELTTLSRNEAGWQLQFANGLSAQHATVVLAHGHRVTQHPETHALPLTAVRGQVSHVPVTDSLIRLKQVLCYDGYITPVNPIDSLLCLGASYDRHHPQTGYSEREQQDNRERLLRCLPNVEWPQEVDVSGGFARSGVRCTCRDHLPMVGAVPDFAATCAAYSQLPQRRQKGEKLPTAPVYPNLFLFAGLGSRGLCSAPLLAEVLAAQLFGEPQPLDQALLNALNPNRMWVRKLLKGKAVENL